MLQHSERWLDAKPYREIFDGRVHRKVSPQFNHGRIQAEISALLLKWAPGRGGVATEWRIRLDEETTLVPDVSFESDERLAGLSEDERQTLPFSPQLVVEIRSPRDRRQNIERKTELYLRHGAIAVLNVDPTKRTVYVTTQDAEFTLKDGDAFTHAAFPGLELRVSDIFAPLARRY
jgi:Uma2 family endonuclease